MVILFSCGVQAIHPLYDWWSKNLTNDLKINIILCTLNIFVKSLVDTQSLLKSRSITINLTTDL